MPCFEVWLSAHYAPVKSYRDQADAQAHYLELAGLSKKNAKKLPDDFPCEEAARAVAGCHLPTDNLPELGAQGPRPSTTMTLMLRSLGLLDAAEL